MSLNISTEEAYAQGRKAAEEASHESGGGDIWKQMRNKIKWATKSYPAVAELDLQEMVLRFSREQMDVDPDFARFPECRDLREAVEAERRGFAEIIDDPYAAAFQFDWDWFCSRRLNTRFVGKLPSQPKCTAFWFDDSEEGGPIKGGNLDDVVFMYEEGFAHPPESGPKEAIVFPQPY